MAGPTLEGGRELFHSAGEVRQEELEGWVKERGSLLAGNSSTEF